MRRRYRMDKSTGKLVEVTRGARETDGPFFMRDLNEMYREGGFRSPIDGEWIDSRAKLRAHERKHDVRQCGDYQPGEQVQRLKDSYARSRAELAQETGIEFKWE